MSDFFYTYYRRHGNKILMRYVKNGKAKNRVIDFYEPTLYVDAAEDSDITNIYSHRVKPVSFDSMKQADLFAEQYKDVDGMNVYGNNDYTNQFIIELFDGDTPNFDANQIKIGYIDIEVHAETFPDPEVHRWPVNAITVYHSTNKQYTTWGLEHGESYSQEHQHKKVRPLAVEYRSFSDEKDMLRDFLLHMNREEYHITTGWNSELFDWPYLINRCYRLFGEAYTKKMLSPFNMIQRTEVPGAFGGKPKTKYKVVGVPDLDYMALYKKHVFVPRESYRLDFIAEAELDERKLDYSEYGGLDTLYLDNYQLFIDYNIIDVDLIRRLDERLGLFNQTYALAYYALTNYEDTLGTVRIWEHLIAKFLYKQGQVPLYFGIKGVDRSFQGAYVKEPRPGMYEWVVSCDLNSLYPHIEIQYNIGPETHLSVEDVESLVLESGDAGAIEYIESGQFRVDREKYTVDDIINERLDDRFRRCVQLADATMAANFHFYRRDKPSFFSSIKSELYNERKTYKKKMLEQEQLMADAPTKEEKRQYSSAQSQYHNMQMALKILLNGGYGALANKHFLYYMVDNAEAITASGRLINKWTGTRVDGFLNDILGKGTYWVYSDTDSGYFTLKPFVEQVFGDDVDDKQSVVNTIDQFYKEVLGPKIDGFAQDMCEYVNGREQKMVWEREVISERAVWLARKRYVMTVWDNEGVRYHKEPKLKYMGVDAVRSSTPAWSREALKECYMIALTDGEQAVQQYISEVYGSFLSKRVDEIAIPTGVNGILKYADDDNIFTKGTPKHVKAALIHNHLVDKHDANVNKITDGNKIKYVPLKMPNPIKQEVVAFEQFLPKDFKVDEYVDYDAVFERAFAKPVDAFLTPIGWTAEETNTLF